MFFNEKVFVCIDSGGYTDAYASCYFYDKIPPCYAFFTLINEAFKHDKVLF